MKLTRQIIRPTLLVALLLATAGALLTSLTDNALLPSASARQAAPDVVVTNAASFANDGTVTPDTLASAFGAFQTLNNQLYIANTIPLPTVLGGVRVTINGVEASLIFTSNGQINFVVPSSITSGTVTVVVTNSNNTTKTGPVLIAPAAPGIFTATSDGQGVAAAQTTNDGVNYLNIVNGDGTARDVDAGTVARPNVLVLYVTGVRHAPAANPNDTNGVAEAVTVTIQGVPTQVLYAGLQGGFAGLDQVNVIIPPELAGLGSVKIKISVNGHLSNVVTMKLGGNQVPVRTQPLGAGDVIAGALTADDQVQDAGDGSGDSFFFDAYRFHATANTSIAVDLRSSQFDAALLIYRVDSATGNLNFLAFDDQFGGLGNGRGENNNSLLLMVLPSESDYVILASTANEDPNGTGNYTLQLLVNPFSQITYGANFNSVGISSSDLLSSAGDYLDAYWFSGTQGDNVRIKMASTAFDSFLILHNNSGDEVAFDDNRGGGPFGVDAQIDKILPATGIYIIIATPFAPSQTGNYTLSLTRASGFQAEGSAIEAVHSSVPGRVWPGENIRRDNRSERYATRRVIRREQ